MTNIELALLNLSKDQTLKICPQGTSMCPTFLGGRDEVYLVPATFPVKCGEIALFLREDQTYVIHRVWKVIEKEGIRQYYMLGDNQTEIEGPINESQIHATAVSFTRKRRTVNCKKDIPYRIYVFLWMLVMPLRPFFQGIAAKLRKLKNNQNS